MGIMTVLGPEEEKRYCTRVGKLNQAKLLDAFLGPGRALHTHATKTFKEGVCVYI